MTSEYYESNFSIKNLIRENQELKDALIQSTKFENAYSLKKEIYIPKEKFNELINGINKSDSGLFIKYNEDGSIKSIKSDVSKSKNLTVIMESKYNMMDK